ncbi:MAG: hypothetical protein KDC95_17560 [Planctomycetes bacterium]|nr:hypothetical protein [Planctomycetota bacterium]
MKRVCTITTLTLALTGFARTSFAQTSGNRVLAWNDLGMHCIDPDFSVFTILPPFNTSHAHVIIGGKLQTPGVYQLSFRGIADKSGSINTTSIGKTNFWDHVKALYGISIPPDVGLTGTKMPGAANTPQPMPYDTTFKWFTAEGLPVTPLDDNKKQNPYPLFEYLATDTNNNVVASTVAVVPTSNELRCDRCHASGQNPMAMPDVGWAFDTNPIRDNRLNILRLHDQRNIRRTIYKDALKAKGYNALGLYETVVTDGIAILCHHCHESNAQPGLGYQGISPLTVAMHDGHSDVIDVSGKQLDEITTRASCYVCHPGHETKCLRGAMGTAVGADGQFAMECQSCHGDMEDVGKTGRAGWFDEPTCQNCHTGSATTNSGEIRYTNVFDTTGQRRNPASQLFATNPNTPAPGVSLYRFSKGHGDMQCAACHGPPHAIYPSPYVNDNELSLKTQGHIGTITDCSSCHTKLEDNQLMSGPHGMHDVSNAWAADKHGDFAERNLAQCQVCHGADSRGTVLSRAQGDRTYATKFGTKTFFRGQQIGCYVCHNGPRSDNRINNQVPVAQSQTLSTPNDVPLDVTLAATDGDSDPLTYRIVTQSLHGKVAIQNNKATYTADPGYVGTDSFTFAANDTKIDSNLATITIAVGSASCQGEITSYGFGCQGTGKFLPVLTGTGCPKPGNTITLDLDYGLGGSVGVLLFGANRTLAMLPRGCALRIDPVLLISPPIPLSGTAPGEGKFSVPLVIPSTVTTGSLTMQALILDRGSLFEWSMSGGLEIVVR